MRTVFFSLVLLGATWLSGCTPDKNSASLGPLPKASFAVAPVSGAVNLFATTASTSGVFSWFWDPGDGSGQKQGNANDTLYYRTHGNYRVTLLVLGQGGYDTVSQIVQVATDDPGINILQDTTFTSNTAWTTLNTGAPVTTTTLNAPGLNLSNPPNSGFTNSGIYQPVAVTAGVPYTFHANVQGAGATNTWVEVYIGWTQPTQGKDYTDTKLWSLNTWSGCGASAFNGNIVGLSCSGSGAKSGAITFAKSGTVYLVVKAGSAGGSLGAGGVTFTSIGFNKPSH